VTSNSVSNNAGGLKETEATCPSGKQDVGGGAQPISSPAYYAAGYPVGDNAFHAIGSSPAGPAFSVRAFAICATVAGQVALEKPRLQSAACPLSSVGRAPPW
jgi:hypothetical protein